MSNETEKTNNPFHLKWNFPQRKSYEGYKTKNIHITMRDGVKIAATICLPYGITAEDKLPTLLYQTRYWRAAKLRLPFRWVLTETSIFTPGFKKPSALARPCAVIVEAFRINCSSSAVLCLEIFAMWKAGLYSFARGKSGFATNNLAQSFRSG